MTAFMICLVGSLICYVPHSYPLFTRAPLQRYQDVTIGIACGLECARCHVRPSSLQAILSVQPFGQP